MDFLQSMGAAVRHLPSRFVQGSFGALWLLLAHVVWVILAIGAIGLFVMSLPAGFTQLHRLCANGACPLFWQLPPHDLQVLERWGISLDFYAVYNLALALTLMLSYSVVGLIIFWQKRRDGLALFLSLTLILWGAVGIFSDQLVALQPAWKAALTLMSFTSTAFTLIFVYVFPTGRFVPRPLVWLMGVLIVLEVTYSFFPDSPLSQRTWPLWLSTLTWVCPWVIASVSQIYRYVRVSTQIERQQTRWVVFGLAVSLCLLLTGGLVQALLQPRNASGETQLLSLLVEQFLAVLALVFPPICIGIAILRYRLWDIDIIINRTLVYGALTASIVGLYVLVVGYLGALFRTGSNLLISLVATGLVAVLFQPLRISLQKLVNRLMFGERDDPYGVLSRLGQRLEATLAPDTVLPTIAETIARALKLPYVALTLAQGPHVTTAAAYGEPIENPLRVPLTYQKTQVGELMLAPRGRGETFTPADLRLLGDLARQVGIAAHAVRLTADLQQSRERLVTTREEERRRLRRDLHDGLGPTLAGFSLKVGAVHNLLHPGQETAKTLLNELSTDIEGAIVDIRRIVYDLRPPSLDELGLVGALRARAAQYNTPPGKLSVLVQAPEALPPFPAAIEVAVYRIFQEALTNVMRHAEARTCTVILSTAHEIGIEIIDDGKGLPTELHTGVGLLAMRERAVELGGACVIETAQPCGTRIYARFPLRKE